MTTQANTSATHRKLRAQNTATLLESSRFLAVLRGPSKAGGKLLCVHERLDSTKQPMSKTTLRERETLLSGRQRCASWEIYYETIWLWVLTLSESAYGAIHPFVLQPKFDEMSITALAKRDQSIRQSTSAPFSAPAGTCARPESLPHAFDPASLARDSCQSTS